MRRFWTPEEVETLARLRSEGRTLPEIAARLGRSLHAVTQRCYLLGIPRALSVRYTRLRTVLLGPWNDTEAASLLGYKKSSISKARSLLRRELKENA